MIPAAILGLMKDDVTVQLVTNHDGYNNPVLGAATSMKARVSYRRRAVTQVGQDDIVSEITVYLAEDVELTVDGKITLPDGSAPPIKHVRRPAWPDGTRHVEVLL